MKGQGSTATIKTAQIHAVLPTMSPALLTVLFPAPGKPQQYLTKAHKQAAFPVCMQLRVNSGSCSSLYIPGDKQSQTDSRLKQGKETLGGSGSGKGSGEEVERLLSVSPRILSHPGRTQDSMNEPAGSPQWIPFTRRPAYIWGTTEASAFSALALRSHQLFFPPPTRHRGPGSRLTLAPARAPSGSASPLALPGQPHKWFWELEQQFCFMLLGLGSLPWFSLLFVCFSGDGVGIIDKWFQ